MFLSPDVLIDISAHHDLKLDSLRAHRSQRIPVENVCNTGAYWGRVAGAPVAEAFKIIRRYG